MNLIGKWWGQYPKGFSISLPITSNPNKGCYTKKYGHPGKYPCCIDQPRTHTA
jgi:hypothetical protein